MHLILSPVVKNGLHVVNAGVGNLGDVEESRHSADVHEGTLGLDVLDYSLVDGTDLEALGGHPSDDALGQCRGS